MRAPTDIYIPPLNSRSLLSIDRTSFRNALLSLLAREDLSMDFISSNLLIKTFASADWLELWVFTGPGAACSSFGMNVSDRHAVSRQKIIFFILLIFKILLFYNFITADYTQ